MNTSLLNSISEKDIEKFKLLVSIFNESNKTNAVTLRVFEDEYLNYVKGNHSPSYVRSIENSFKHLNAFFKAQKIITEIKQKDAEQFILWLKDKSKKGYRVYYRTLKAAFNKATEWEYISVNPFVKIKLPKVQRVAPKYVTGDQLSVICERIENDIVRDIIKTAFYTGMRLNEVVNLKWRNVDLEKGIITVGDEEFTTKGRNQRYVPVCEELNDLFVRREIHQNDPPEKWRADGGQAEDVRSEYNTPRPDKTGHPSHRGDLNNGFVFCKENGEAYTGDYVSKSFRSACRSEGIDKGIHFHSLRHSFASNLVQKGVSLYLVKELLGHSSISTTEIYSHLNVESLREAVMKL